MVVVSGFEVVFCHPNVRVCVTGCFRDCSFVDVVVQFCFWFNLDFPLFDIHYHILA